MPAHLPAPFAGRPTDAPVKIPSNFLVACRQRNVFLTRFLLSASITRQTLLLFERMVRERRPSGKAGYALRQRYRLSTSRYGTGQVMGSKQTPLGLHRVAAKIGGGQPVGAVFAGRQLKGFTWAGHPSAAIAHRILWLEGLEPGLNQGGSVDSYRRYIYIHGVGDEMTLNRPSSSGCLHLAGKELLPLYDRLPVGTLVWIQR